MKESSPKSSWHPLSADAQKTGLFAEGDQRSQRSVSNRACRTVRAQAAGGRASPLPAMAQQLVLPPLWGSGEQQCIEGACPPDPGLGPVERSERGPCFLPSTDQRPRAGAKSAGRTSGHSACQPPPRNKAGQGLLGARSIGCGRTVAVLLRGGFESPSLKGGNEFLC